MPVMKALNIDGTTYTTTGEVTVTQTLSSGTEIGSIDVDGTSTTLYAPTASTITVDSALSSSSTNPVQNKVIYTAIGDIETLLAAL